jgi:hypothetical protein
VWLGTAITARLSVVVVLCMLKHDGERQHTATAAGSTTELCSAMGKVDRACPFVCNRDGDGRCR